MRRGEVLNTYGTESSLVVQTVKNPPAGDLGLIPGSERPPGGGNGNLLQYSGLENSMLRGALLTAVHGVAESRDTTE